MVDTGKRTVQRLANMRARTGMAGDGQTWAIRLGGEGDVALNRRIQVYGADGRDLDSPVNHIDVAIPPKSDDEAIRQVVGSYVAEHGLSESEAEKLTGKIVYR